LGSKEYGTILFSEGFEEITFLQLRFATPFCRIVIRPLQRTRRYSGIGSSASETSIVVVLHDDGLRSSYREIRLSEKH
jgi:hypothetical protein